MTSPLEVLEQAHALIRDPRHWCQHAGQILGVQRCSTFAMLKVAAGADDTYFDAIKLLFDCIPKPVHGDYSVHSVVVYNDSHKHYQVMRLWRLAIASEKVGGKAARARARRIRQKVIAMRKQAQDVVLSSSRSETACESSL